MKLTPPGAKKLLEDHATIMEELGGGDQKVLTQFNKDAKHFKKNQAPKTFLKYLNVVDFDPNANKKRYEVKVWFYTGADDKNK